MCDVEYFILNFEKYRLGSILIRLFRTSHIALFIYCLDCARNHSPPGVSDYRSTLTSRRECRHTSFDLRYMNQSIA